MFEVSIAHYVHSGGTKDYTLVYIRPMEQLYAVYAKQWGKVGIIGVGKVSSGRPSDIRHAFGNECTNRESRGYSKVFEHNVNIRHLADLSLHGLGSAHLLKIQGALRRAAEELNAIEEFGGKKSYVGDTQSPETPGNTMLDDYADNELFGSF